MTFTGTPSSDRVWPICQIGSGTMPTTGDRIRRARTAAGLSQRELAVATGVGQRTIGRIETDQGGSPRNIRRLQDHLGLHDEDARDAPGALAISDEPDLSTVGTTALLAEVAARLAAAERRGGPLVDGPPIRVRFKTADAPTGPDAAGRDRDLPDAGQGR